MIGSFHYLHQPSFYWKLMLSIIYAAGHHGSQLYFILLITIVPCLALAIPDLLFGGIRTLMCDISCPHMPALWFRWLIYLQIK